MFVSETRKGEWYLFSGTFLVALLPVVAVLSFAKIPPLISLGWSTAFAAVFLGFLVINKGLWHELWNPILWKHIFFVTLFISILTYGLFFIGLEKTTPGNAAIISLFEVCTTFLFFNIFRKERISYNYKAGAFLMLVGALVVVARDFSHVNVGDLLILGSTLFAPIGNLFQQKAREIASSETIMFLRSILAAPLILVCAYAFSPHVSAHDLYSAAPFLFINGAVFLGFSRVLWVEAIHRISVTKAQALASIAPLITLFFAWLLLGQEPRMWQLVALVPLVLGTLLLTDHWKLTRE